MRFLITKITTVQYPHFIPENSFEILIFDLPYVNIHYSPRMVVISEFIFIFISYSIVIKVLWVFVQLKLVIILN